MLLELLTFRSHLDAQEREELDIGGLLVHTTATDAHSISKIYSSSPWAPVY
jgi:hypothetical protein